MNQIDYGILGGYKFAPSANDQMQQALSLKQMADNQYMAQQRFGMDQQKFANEQQTYAREQQENEALKQLYPRFIDQNGDGDRDGFIREVARINPNKAMALKKEFMYFDKMRADMQKTQAEIDNIPIENEMRKTDLGIKGIVAKTNAQNASTQAGNLKLNQDKFEYEKNKPKDVKPVPVGSSDAITGTGFALGKLKTLYDKVNGGDADVFKTTITGAFVDPELNDAIKQLTEFHGRKQSGAAISKSEWNNFKSQILNPKYLLTIKGRKAAIKNLEDYIGKYYAQGEKVAGSDTWYDEYQKSAEEGVNKITKKDDFDSLWNEVNQ